MACGHDINEKYYYYWQRQVRKEAFEQIKHSLPPAIQFGIRISAEQDHQVIAHAD